MKVKFYLGALAAASLLAACTSDDFDGQDNGQALIPGATLVSKGLTISMEQDNGQTTRLDASGWAAGDKSGLVWATTGDRNINENQDRATAPYADASDAGKNYAAANDLFIYDSGDFNTVSNIYRGWHFAYYPYSYQAAAGAIQFNTVNSKPQTTDFATDRYNAPYVSDRIFLSATNEGTHYANGTWQFPANVNSEEGTLVEGTHLTLKRIVNILKYQLNIQEEIKAKDGLKNLPLKSLAVSEDYTNFLQTITINPKALPEVGATGVNYSTLYGNAATYPTNQDKQAFIGSGNTNEVVTSFEKATDSYTFDMSKDNVARMFVAPMQSGTDLSTDATGMYYNLQYTIPSVGGSFVIKHHTVASGSDAEKINEAALLKFVQLSNGTYCTNPDETDPSKKIYRTLQAVYDAKGGVQPAQTIELALDAEYFVLDAEVHVKTCGALVQELTALQTWAKVGVKPATVKVYLDGDANKNFDITKEAIDQAQAILNSKKADSNYPITLEIYACDVSGEETTNLTLTTGTNLVKFAALKNEVSITLGANHEWSVGENTYDVYDKYNKIINRGTANISGITAAKSSRIDFDNEGTVNLTNTNVFGANYTQGSTATMTVSGTTTINNDADKFISGSVTVNASAKLLTTDRYIKFEEGATVENFGKIATQGTGAGKIANYGVINAKEGSETYIYDNARNTNSTNVDDYGYIYLASRNTKVSVSANTEQGFLVYTWGNASTDGDSYSSVSTDRFNSIKVTSSKALTSIQSNLAGLFFAEGTDVEWLGNATNTVNYLEVKGTISVQKGYTMTVVSTGKSKITGTVNVGGTYIYGSADDASKKNIYNNGGTVKAN